MFILQNCFYSIVFIVFKRFLYRIFFVATRQFLCHFTSKAYLVYAVYFALFSSVMLSNSGTLQALG